jgi:hypothetical protein
MEVAHASEWAVPDDGEAECWCVSRESWTEESSNVGAERAMLLECVEIRNAGRNDAAAPEVPNGDGRLMVELNTCRGCNRCVASDDVKRAEGAENWHLSVKANGFGAVGQGDEPLGTRERSFNPHAAELCSNDVTWLGSYENGAAGCRKIERLCRFFVGKGACKKAETVIVVGARSDVRIGGVGLRDGHS